MHKDKRKKRLAKKQSKKDKQINDLVNELKFYKSWLQQELPNSLNIVSDFLPEYDKNRVTLKSLSFVDIKPPYVIPA